MQYTEKELEKLISEVEQEFTSHLAKAEENFKLAKSEDSDEAPPKKKEKEEKDPEAEESQAPQAEAQAPAQGEENQDLQAEAQAPAQAPVQGEASCDYDDQDMEHMKSMYMSMSDSELKAHHDAIAMAANGRDEMGGCGDSLPGRAPSPAGEQPPKMQPPKMQPSLNVQKSELNAHPENAPMPKDKTTPMNNDKANGGIKAQAPNNALGPKSAASVGNGKQMSKSEHDRRNGGKVEGQMPGNTPGAKSADSDANGESLNKSENNELELLKSEVAAEKAKTETLQKNLDAVSSFLTKLVEKRVAPQGKAITSLDVIAKSESVKEEKILTKNEIDSALSRKAQDSKLEKSDRDAINAYYLNGASIKTINHLLK